MREGNPMMDSQVLLLSEVSHFLFNESSKE